MGDKWKEMKFEDVVDINPLRKILRGEIAPHVSMDTVQPFTRMINHFEMKEFKGSGSRFKNGDTLLARITPCLENGKTVFLSCLPNDVVGHGSTEFIVLSGRDGISDNLFVYYLARDPEFRNYAIQHMEGSTGRQRVPASAIARLTINIPPLPEQKAIASILGALDDKIELNRKMNETLEAMARAIFKSWFVDFDPIPGIDPHKEWQNSPLGKIPKGWRVSSLGELVDFINERVEATPEKDREKYIALDDMPHRSVDLAQFRSGSEVNSSIIRFKEGDILFGAMRPYFHKVGLAQFEGITRTTTFVLRPKQPHMCLFALMNFFSDSVIEYATNASIGSTIPYIKWNALAGYQILMPTKDLIEKYNNFTMPMIRQIKMNSKQSLSLSSIRDALLPKLLSGEIRVKDTEKFVGKAL